MGQETISDNIQLRSEKLKPDDTGYEGLSQQDSDGNFTLSVLVSGVHCAGCIQKIESSLSKVEGIKSARLNFSTGRLAVVWSGDAILADDYVNLIEALGYKVSPYDADTQKSEINIEEQFLLLCLGVAGFAMGNVMLLSVGLWSSSGESMGFATRDFMHWVSAFIALPTILFSGRPFFRSALKALSAGHTNMDVPVSLALVLAASMSLYETINHGEHVYFDSAVMLIFFLLIGRYLDFRARKNARSSATDLLDTLTGFANVVDGNKTRRILIRDVREGMSVRVNAGDKFPVDGIVISGDSEVDTSLVTGETMPREIAEGGQVFAGTMNMSAPVVIEVSKAAEDSLLADIVRLMEKAGQGQAKYVRLADRAAKLYTPVVHICAAAAFLGWFFVGSMVWQDALMISVTVLIITCPCALGLAVPVVQVLASGRLMRNGILVKSGDALERLAKIDTILLDKTGTLTLGTPELDGEYNKKTLQLAASLAAHSSHPLSKAIVKAFALENENELLEITGVQEHAGKGVEGIYLGKKLQLGSSSWLGDKRASSTNRIQICLKIEGGNIERLYFTDYLRTDTAEIIKKFKVQNITPIMLSGDRLAVAEKIAEECGITQVYAEKTPTQKYDVLEVLKSKNHHILMVGDGLNDAPVLAGADVSIAPGSAIDMAQNAADIIFMGDELAPVYQAHKTAILTQKLVKQNFALAIAYNIIAVPLALAGFVTPLFAAIAMSSSSLLVIANSFRLRFAK